MNKKPQIQKPVFVSKEERQRRAQQLANSIDQPIGSIDHSVDHQSARPNHANSHHLNTVELIKKRYLGESAPKEYKKKDKRFRFEWDESDDTTSIVDPLYLSPPIRKTQHTSALKRDPLDIHEKHWTQKSLMEMKERDWRIFREDYSITTKGGSVPHPIRYWDEYREVPDDLFNVIVKTCGYKEPTPIQRQAIPAILQERDLIGLAETGSGKTAAFITPILIGIRKLLPTHTQDMISGPYCLIMVPTRELALQIEGEALKFCSTFGVRVLSIVGGHSIVEQSFDMRNGVEMVVGTPGRLKDCLEQHILSLDHCRFVVLDEADRMIDLGFEEDVSFIMNQMVSINTTISSSKSAFDNSAVLSHNNYHDSQQIIKSKPRLQVVMFSATMPLPVERLAQQYLDHPITVRIGNPGKSAVDKIVQRIEMVGENFKRARMLEIVQFEGFSPPIIIFANQKKTVDSIAKVLNDNSYKVVTLHGGKSQDQREHSLNQLKSGLKEILIATDVAGRGLDVRDVGLVLNYDMAKSVEDYIHRIGRTGRAGRDGFAVTFLTPDDSPLFFELKQVLCKSDKNIMPSEFLRHQATQIKPGSIEVKRRHEQVVFAA